MKLGHEADEIKYVGTVGTVARYAVILEGDVVMAILCDSADAERTIRISHKDNVQDTAGRFELTTDFKEGPNGELLDVAVRVNEKSVYSYAIPRLHILLARLLKAA